MVRHLLSSRELISELHLKFRERQCHGRSTHELRQIADRMWTTRPFLSLCFFSMASKMVLTECDSEIEERVK